MARPLRLEFSGALYHITSRGNRQESIYESDADRENFLEILGKVCERYNWECHAYCLMNNHYHLLIETPDANLSQGMRQLNGVYTQAFNRINERVGHVFQGRYKSILVEKESYLLELARYIALNPVRAKIVNNAKDWPWSSYRTTAGLEQKPIWLNTDWLLAAFGVNKRKAVKAYQQFVSEGKDQSSPWSSIRNQVYLGGKEFVKEMQSMIEQDKDLCEVPRSQRRPTAQPIEYYESRSKSRNDAIVETYRSGGYNLKQIGEHFGLHYSTVSGIVKNHKSKT